MLFEDITTGAVLAGYSVSTNGKLTGAQAREIEAALDQLRETYDHKIRLFVPGDSATDHAMNPDMELYAFNVVFGVAAMAAGTWSCPAELSVEAVEQAVQTVADTPADFWEALASKVPLLADFDFGEPETYLTSWGPLPYACLAAGVIHPKDERDDTTYDFFSVQDMSQMWLDDGVDGVRIASAEYTDVYNLDLSAEAVAGWLEKAGELDAPKIYMTVRYD